MKTNLQTITMDWKTVIVWLAAIVVTTCGVTFTGMQFLHSYATDNLKREIKELRVLGGMDIKDLAIKLGENAKKLRITVDEQRLLKEQQKSIFELERNLELAQKNLKNKTIEIEKLTKNLADFRDKYKAIIGNSNFIDAEFVEDKIYEVSPNDIFISIDSVYDNRIIINSPKQVYLDTGELTVFYGGVANCSFRFLERVKINSARVRYKCDVINKIK